MHNRYVRTLVNETTVSVRDVKLVDLTVHFLLSFEVRTNYKVVYFYVCFVIRVLFLLLEKINPFFFESTHLFFTICMGVFPLCRC